MPNSSSNAKIVTMESFGTRQLTEEEGLEWIGIPDGDNGEPGAETLSGLGSGRLGQLARAQQEWKTSVAMALGVSTEEIEQRLWNDHPSIVNPETGQLTGIAAETNAAVEYASDYVLPFRRASEVFGVGGLRQWVVQKRWLQRYLQRDQRLRGNPNWRRGEGASVHEGVRRPARRTRVAAGAGG